MIFNILHETIRPSSPVISSSYRHMIKQLDKLKMSVVNTLKEATGATDATRKKEETLIDIIGPEQLVK